MKNRFKDLLFRYQNENLTSTERSEFLAMVRTGDYDKEIGERWIALLESELNEIDERNSMYFSEIEEVRKSIYADSRMIQDSRRSFRTTRILVWSSVAAVAMLIIGTIFWERNHSMPDPDAMVEIIQDQPSGHHFNGKQFIHLPDGSTVILNEESELSFSSDFGRDLREVQLIGEAFFDVAHDADHPFIVKTGAVNTRVLGTAFNVTAWPNQDEIKVTVERGKVSVGDDREVYEELLPNEQLAVDTESREYEKTVLGSEQEIEWKKTFFVLDEVSMDNAMQKIGERYDVKVEIVNPALRNCIVNGAFLDNESLEHVLSVLSLAMNAEYKIEQGSIKILGGIGCGNN